VERGGKRLRRRFRTPASFDGGPDLGARAKDIAREAWDGQERQRVIVIDTGSRCSCCC